MAYCAVEEPLAFHLACREKYEQKGGVPLQGTNCTANRVTAAGIAVVAIGDRPGR